MALHTRFILDCQKTTCEKWNSTGSQFITNLDFATKIADMLNVEPKFNFVVDHRPGHEVYLSMSESKLFEHGWTNNHNLWNQLESTVNWYVSNPAWIDRR